jgi:hypothetical protein
MEASTGLACGPHNTCDPATQYCLEGVGGVNGTAYGCNTIPQSCEPNPTCACVTISACTCTDQGGAITVQCPVG